MSLGVFYSALSCGQGLMDPAQLLCVGTQTGSTDKCTWHLHPAHWLRVCVCVCTQEAKHWEAAFQVYEKGTSLFKYPHVADIWAAYLKSFVARCVCVWSGRQAGSCTCCSSATPHPHMIATERHATTADGGGAPQAHVQHVCVCVSPC